MKIKFPCAIFKRTVAKNHKALQCDLCDQWIHIKCNLIDKKTYEKLKHDTSFWFCINCSDNIFPYVQHDSPEMHEQPQQLTSKQQEIINDLNQAINDPDHLPSSKYYTPEEFKQLSFFSTELLALHLNISSLPFHIDDLHSFLANLPTKPSIFGITESRLKQDNPSLINISIPVYNIEHTDTESANGESLLYISKNLNYISRSDLALYKAKELESVFVEIDLPKRKRNLVVGCIYRHPFMNTDEFNTQYLPKLLFEISKEVKVKDFLIMGDFNIDLLNYDTSTETSDFLDKMYPSSFLPLITHPTRFDKTSQTLIDNIFTTLINNETKAGNITTVISDHFCQFASLPILENTTFKNVRYERNFRNFNKSAFSDEMKNINWEDFLEANKKNADLSMNKFLENVNNLIDKHLPIKKLSKQEILQKDKPWMTKGLITSIKNKNIIHRKMLRAKDPTRKQELKEKYKTYKNRLAKLTRNSKANHFNKFFYQNKSNLLKVWDGIKSIISIYCNYQS